MNEFNKEACKTITDAEQRAAAGCTESRTAGGVAGNVINTVLGVLAVVAVIAIILGALQYMTSQGDPQKVKTAKNTITYAVMGLVIAILAFAIVNFVIGAAS